MTDQARAGHHDTAGSRVLRSAARRVVDDWLKLVNSALEATEDLVESRYRREVVELDQAQRRRRR